jgi:NAD-dependent deacetylase
LGSALTLLPDAALERLCSARRVVALTGAGISAESGVPTFRDAQTGLWAKFRAEELATPEAFLENPRLVWDWYAWRRELTGRAEPNPGHAALARFQDVFAQFSLITQNVDGLHARAGSRDVLELHGNIGTTLCFDEGVPVSDYEDDGTTPPRCPRCGALLRPGVVWFGESLPRVALERARKAAEACEVMLSIGTSSLVHPAAGLPLLAQERGALLIEMNPSPTPLTPYVDFALSGPAGQLLPQLLQQIEAVRG